MFLTERIREFRGPYRFLSNYAPSPILLPDGLRYPTVEHAFAAAKTLDRKIRATIARLPAPGDAKRAGRTLDLRGDWETVKISIMRELLEAKFAQNPLLAQALVATDGAQLIEGNLWNDTFWGVDLRTNRGLNNLGVLLMERRAALQSR